MFVSDQNNNNFYGGQMFAGQPGGQPIKQPSTLTVEEYNRLVKQENPFSLALTEIEILRSICNHRTQDGLGDALTQTANGQMRCTICGYEFLPLEAGEMSQDDIAAATKVVIDILQTIKLIFKDMPIETQREYFQIIPLIERIPKLFDLATKNFQKYESIDTWQYRNANMSTINLYNMLTSGLTSIQQPQQMAQSSYGVWGTGAGTSYPPMGGGSPYAPETLGYKFSPTVADGDPNNKKDSGTDGTTVNSSATFKV